MILSSYLSDFASNYLLEKNKKFGSNIIAASYRNELPELLKNTASISDDYRVYSSCGQGQWAEIPWIAVLDKSITKSTQSGYYIVYLFSADMKSLYLFLGLGWTQFEDKFGIRDGRIEIESTATALQKHLRSTSGFSTSKIDLKTNNTLGKGYELGMVLSKKYDTRKLPNDAVLVDDLRNLMGVYRELRGLVGDDVFNFKPSELTQVNEQEISEILESIAKVRTEEEAKIMLKELENSLKNKTVATKVRISKIVARNAKLSNLVKEANNFYCEICGSKPFMQKNGKPYAEAHHVEELAQSRIDHPDNMICVCPLCHKIIHYGSEEELEKRKKLKH
jgi:5-methylcytosine-specific restriction enzyme A